MLKVQHKHAKKEKKITTNWKFYCVTNVIYNATHATLQ